LIAALFWLTISAGMALAATSPLQDAVGNSTTPPAGPPPALADRDGDGLSDALQAKLAKVRPYDLVDVVVTYTGPGNAALAQKAVGPFKLKNEFQIIPGFAGTMTAAQARGLAKVRKVFRVEEDFLVTTTLDAANRDFGTTAARAGYAVTGTGVGICVIDTGVDPGHEQLNGKVTGFVDYINGQSGAYDDHGHGTHVGAIAAGAGGAPGSDAERYQGVAPGASIYGVKALSSTGTGNESDIIAGLQWCSDDIARNATGPGVQIISMSLSSTEPSDGFDAMSQAVNAAVAAGKVVVVGAGNFGAGETTVGSPGAAAQAVTVGAVAEWSADPAAANHSRGIYLAPFSSRGPTLDGRLKPDILAPGVSVTAARANTSNGYITYSGTSMATPFVSGTVALAMDSPASAMTPLEIKNLLMATARDVGPAGMDNDWGAGLIDGYRFVGQSTGDMLADANPFPELQRDIRTVSINDTVEYPFEVTQGALGVPIAATLTILNGDQVCLYGSEIFCDLFGGWAWTPDIDAELIHPNGSVVASSECPLFGDCGSLGRQETLTHCSVTAARWGGRKPSHTCQPQPRIRARIA
jgi:serine protease AprX